MMISVHIYGHLRKFFDSSASLAGDMIIEVSHIKGETFSALMKRMKLLPGDCGECFLNHTLVEDWSSLEVPDGSRVAVFSRGMHLIDGGQYIKGHGYITTKPPRKIEYY
ncbi:MAG: hypothetical protein ACFFD4_31820 [Candidatus Odinarchaeota archaeon]